MESRGGALFREIHKNTWLKRLCGDARRLAVGNRRFERYWVVFCVHDDCEALLEGYAEPRIAPTHVPEWTVSLQTAQHISHTLVPTEQEYEFVITLNTDVIRFSAPSWECMQEWVDTLRSKLREMKILSPRENLYSKLPEMRAPLLPTRDPMSPLPAPPPVPAAIVPGVERVITSPATVAAAAAAATATPPPPPTTPARSTSTIVATTIVTAQSLNTLSTTTTTITSAMSNTLTQNLLNMLSSPIAALSNQHSSADSASESDEDNAIVDQNDDNNMVRQSDDDCHNDSNDINLDASLHAMILGNSNNQRNVMVTPAAGPSAAGQPSTSAATLSVSSLAQTFTANVLADPNCCSQGRAQVRNAISLDVKSSRSTTLSSSDDNDLDTSSTDSTSLFTAEPLIIPRPHTSRSAPTKEAKITKSSAATAAPAAIDSDTLVTAAAAATTAASTNITIIQVSTPLPVPAASVKQSTESQFDFSTDLGEQFASNVQIIPSNEFPTPVSVERNHHQQYSVPNKSITKLTVPSSLPIELSTNTNTASTSMAGAQKIVLTSKQHAAAKPTIVANFSSVTNISMANQNSPPPVQHYEQVFLATTVSPPQTPSTSTAAAAAVTPAPAPAPQPQPPPPPLASPPLLPHISPAIGAGAGTASASSAVVVAPGSPQLSLLTRQPRSASQLDILLNQSNRIRPPRPPTGIGSISNGSNGRNRSPSTSPETNRAAPPLLMRGATEAVITRPSRIDHKNVEANRERCKAPLPHHTNETPKIGQNESSEQRRRSSSTSDASPLTTAGRAANRSAAIGGEIRRMQPAPQPYRNADNASHLQQQQQQSPALTGIVPRLTLREQQVQILRREMMHPSGVRLQLRRKDCIGSIALIDAFGAVWIAGWKQKDHPMLYNVLHIGDQLLSVAGVTVGSAADSHKLIRASTGLYVDLIIRRVPFGRVYVIRREMEGQCLGLIRDGNTATIVDVIPNSLAARHGLPPKTQSCDGLSLTFWSLTEINGRPLNWFSKDTEIKDRLNSVGRDISILVQPVDLVTKLKKQFKSLRSYKDYIVQ